MGKTKEDISGKELIEQAKERVKQKQLQEQQNKKETNNMNKKHIFVTIVLTLLTLTALGSAFYYGIQYGVSTEKSVNQRVLNEAKSLATIPEAKK